MSDTQIVRSTVLRALTEINEQIKDDEQQTRKLRRRRNELICDAVDSGVTMSQIAQTLGYSQPRISQIVAKTRSENDE